MLFAARTAALVILALSACVPSIIVGDQPQDGTTTDIPTDASTGPTDEPTSSSGAPVPGVCGDGVVDAGEACDDGNDEANDGCDAECVVTGAVDWTVEGSGEIMGLAVAPDGTIVACGRDFAGFLTAFAPDGSELWSRQVPSTGEIVVDKAGRVFLNSPLQGVHAYAADGAELWSFNAHPHSGSAGPAGVDVDGERVYFGSYEDESALIVRALDVETGEVMWETFTAGETVGSGDLTVLGDRLYAVGQTLSNGQPLRAGVGVFVTSTGEQLPFELVEPRLAGWTAAAASGDGGLVLVGYGAEEPGFVVRRVGPDLGELWTQGPVGVNEKPRRIAAGPGGRIAVAGSSPADHGSAVRLYGSDGALQWSSAFVEPDSTVETAVAAAFGADFVVVGGIVGSGPDDAPVTNWWIRRLAID